MAFRVPGLVRASATDIVRAVGMRCDIGFPTGGLY